MADYNKVLLMGNLTRDIELRHTPSNMAVANFGLAVGRRYRSKDNELREETTFVDCEAWGKQAEIMSQYLTKGRPVFIEGRLKLDQWQDKDGGNRSKLRVVVENFQFIDGGGGGGGGGGDGGGRRSSETSSQGSQRSSSYDDGMEAHQPISEDDIPF